MKVVNVDDLNHKELSSSKTGEKFSFSSVVTDYFGFKNIFVHHEILAPGIRSSSPHFHTHAEEMIFILQGHPTAQHGNTERLLGPGDFIGFLPGLPEYHVLENRTEYEVALLVISSTSAEDRICFKSSKEDDGTQ